MAKIYVTKTTGVGRLKMKHFTDMNELATSVFEEERLGANVQVFECVPIDHEVYQTQVAISLSPQMKESN